MPPEWFAAQHCQPVLTVTINQMGPSRSTMDLKTAAGYLGFSVRKLRDYCREKRISFSRPDRRTYVFKLADLQEFLAKYRHQRKSVFNS
jgi:excisionase family DNA binding protein